LESGMASFDEKTITVLLPALKVYTKKGISSNNALL
jgi:uncharacterized membrane protein YqaE (UPF0057 family)